MSADHGLPHNWDLERSLLGGLILDPSQHDEIGAILTGQEFARPQHGRLYAILREIKRKHGTADLTVLLDRLEGSERELEGVGGVAYVVALPQACPTVDHLDAYARQIRAHAARRAWQLLGSSIVERAATEEDPEALVEWADGAVSQLRAASASSVNRWRLIGDLAAEALEDSRARAANGGKGRVWTGIEALDKLLVIERTDLVVLAARPAMGKSLVAYQIAEFNAEHYGCAAFRSLEMSGVKIGRRSIARWSGVTVERQASGQHLVEEDFAAIARAIGHNRELPLYVDDSPASTITELRSSLRALKRQRPDLTLAVVDYLQLMDGSSAEQRERQVAGISRGLKLLAKELDVAILALSQLNRSLESRTQKRPLLSDLRESGAIEQDADSIVFLYRDEVYEQKAPENPGCIECIVAKQRQGSLGTVVVPHRLAQMRVG